MFKSIRIAVLLVLLAFVAVSRYRARVKSVEWQYTLVVNLYPINGDGSAVSDEYIRQLKPEDFSAIEEFIQREQEAYGKSQHAGIEIRLKSALKEGPPAPPVEQNMLQIMWWSLQFRWWAYQHAKIVGPGPQVRLFVQFFDPNKSKVHHSTALQEGLIGRVNLFSSKELSQTNNVIIAHELLHTLGATDKYDISNDYPIHPEGFAEPQRVPLLPQSHAEIMGGRIPLTTSDAIIPRHLGLVRIGRKTAQEINLLQ